VRRLAVLICAAVLCTGCSEPPQKEINRAQGALDAARAVGAEQYAPEAFAGAMTSLEQANDAVAQRDYRLALSRALDANERAQEAAKQAADGKARARSEGEAALTQTAASLQQLQASIEAATERRIPTRELLPARRVAKEATTAVQEAREELKAQRYLEAERSLNGVKDRITGQIEAVERLRTVAPAKPTRRKK
jgi:hypothetical protein